MSIVLMSVAEVHWILPSIRFVFQISIDVITGLKFFDWYYKILMLYIRDQYFLRNLQFKTVSAKNLQVIDI